MPPLPTYVLVTPARNEAEYIELTIKSVVAQTMPPEKWVIVSDGSTDGTDEIVTKYLGANPWLELVTLPPRKERNFAGKVHAFNAGYERVRDVQYDIIGNLDGDVSFDSEYFAFLMEQFRNNPDLGVAGTPFREGSFQYDYRFTSIEHVSGQCQLFRKACFEDVGGFVPRRIGGVDLVAVTTARMKGWQTRTFPEKVYEHHRQMSTANNRRLLVPFRGGVTDYALGCHVVWELARCIYQTSRPPIIIGGLLRMLGYMYAPLSGMERQVSKDFMRFRQAEQMARLKAFVSQIFSSKKKSANN